MNLILLNHENVWGSPLASFRRAVVLSSQDTKSKTKHRTSRSLSNCPAALTVRQPTRNGGIPAVKAILGAISALPSTLIAAVGTAAAATTLPITRNAVFDSLKRDVPWPWCSPLAFLGHTYIVLCALYHAECAVLRWPTFRDTALRRAYLDFHNWFSTATGMIVPKDNQRVPYATLLETFLQDSSCDRTDPSPTKPTWTQIILPTFLHTLPMHVWLSATSVWTLALHLTDLRRQLVAIAFLIASGTLVNRVQWALARRVLFSLPVADQSALAVRNLKRDAKARRSVAWGDFQREISRGNMATAWSSLKRFIAAGYRLSQLLQLNYGIGASGGLTAVNGVLHCILPAMARTKLVQGIVRPLAFDLAEADTVLTFQAIIGMQALELFQDSLIHDQPRSAWVQALLQPTYRAAFVSVSGFRIVEYVLALAPSVGHLAHLIGTAVGVSTGGFLWLLGRHVANRRLKIQPFVIGPRFTMPTFAR